MQVTNDDNHNLLTGFKHNPQIFTAVIHMLKKSSIAENNAALFNKNPDGYPFKPVIEMPSMKERWVKKNRIMIGIPTSVLAAIR